MAVFVLFLSSSPLDLRLIFRVYIDSASETSTRRLLRKVSIKMASLRVIVGYIGSNLRHSDNKAMERPTHRGDNTIIPHVPASPSDSLSPV